MEAPRFYVKRCLLFLAVAVIAAPGIASSPEQLMSSGKAALAHNENDKAAALFQQVVAAKPNDSEAHRWLGRAYGQQARNASIFGKAGLAAKARDEFERAVQLDPNNTGARFDLVQYYQIAPSIMGGSEEKALQQAQEIRKRDALAGHRAMAWLYAVQKKPDLARKEYIDAVREQPNSAKAHAMYAQYLMNDKSWAQALAEFETAVRLDPSYMPAHFRIGQMAVLSNSNFVRGEQSLRKYLAFRPGDEDPPLARAHYWLGQIYEKQGRRAEAKQSYETSLRLTPGAKDVTDALKRVQ